MQILARSTRCVLGATLSVAVLAAGAQADTWLVDDDGGPGVDFTDIQPAVDAASAGDLIRVAPGQYTGFVLEKGLTILGSPGVELPERALVREIPAGAQAALADLALRNVRVRDSDGVVVLDALRFPYSLPHDITAVQQFVEVKNCLDVRLRGCRTEPGVEGNSRGVHVSAARAELVDCEWHGSFHGVECSDHARVHLALTSASGDAGYDDPDGLCSDPWDPSNYAGDGGSGCFVDELAEAIVCGRASDLLTGGDAGTGCDCEHDGYAGAGIDVHEGFARWSGVTLVPGATLDDCTSHGAEPVEGPNVQARPDDPSLKLLGTPAPGALVRFVVRGETGAEVRLHLGRSARVVPAGASPIERLTSEERSLSLGAMPAGGVTSLELRVPAHLPAGFTFFAQAETVAESDARRTNSCPVVVR